jgi:uncharacterized lipoprotein YajG
MKIMKRIEKRNRMKKLLVILALLCVAACVPQQGTPGYSLAGPSGNSTGYSRPVQQTEGGGTNE